MGTAAGGGVIAVALCEQGAQAQVTIAPERKAPGDVGQALARVPASSSRLAQKQKRVGQDEHSFESAVARDVVARRDDEFVRVGGSLRPSLAVDAGDVLYRFSGQWAMIGRGRRRRSSSHRSPGRSHRRPPPSAGAAAAGEGISGRAPNHGAPVPPLVPSAKKVWFLRILLYILGRTTTSHKELYVPATSIGRSARLFLVIQKENQKNHFPYPKTVRYWSGTILEPRASFAK